MTLSRRAVVLALVLLAGPTWGGMGPWVAQARMVSGADVPAPVGARLDLGPSSWNVAYDTSDDPVVACKAEWPQEERDDCYASVGLAMARDYIHFSTLQAGLPKARAGIGVSYDVQSRCSGQQPPAALNVTFGYHRFVNLTVPSLATPAVDLFFSADLRAPGPTEDDLSVPGTQPSGHFSAAQRVADTQTVRATLASPALGAHKAIVYARADPGAKTPPDTLVDASIHLDSISLDWGDTTAPTLVADVRTASGATTRLAEHEPAAWWHEPFDLLLTADDPASCPKWIDWGAYTPPSQTPWAAGRYDVPPSKAPLVLPFGTDQIVRVLAKATDFAGNEGPLVNVLFGLDRVAPTVGLTIDPATPTGDAGWYKAPGPAVDIACTDATSGCQGPLVSFDGGATWSGGLPHYDPGRIREGAYAFACRSRDVSGLTNGDGCAASLKVDTRAPTVRGECTPVGGGPQNDCEIGGWRNAPQSVRLVCDDPASGCASLEYATSGPTGPWSTWAAYDHPFDVAREGTTRINVRARDVAGNVLAEGTRILAIRIDTTPPTLQPFTVSVDGHLLTTYATSVRPIRWSWQAPVDPVPAGDASSGVASETITVNGNERGVTSARVYETRTDGRECLSLVAWDAAGNEARTPEQCHFLDTVAPTIAIDRPQGGTVYDNGNVAFCCGPPQVIVILGSFTFQARASDPAPSSGLTRLHMGIGLPLCEAGGCFAQESECAPTATCQIVKPAPSPVNVESGPHQLVVDAEDAVGHAPRAIVPYDYVGLFAIGGTTAAGASYVRAEWLPWDDPATFTRYEIHRGVTPDFTPSAATWLGSVTDMGATAFRDKTAAAGVTFTYKVVYVTHDASGAERAMEGDRYPARPPLLTEGAGERVLPRDVQLGP